MADSDEEVLDSPINWVRRDIDAYVANDGAMGWASQYPMLLLTTRGRKTGNLRRTALIFGRDGENFLLVASNGGSEQHPSWYLNIVATPEVSVQVGAEVFGGRTHTARPEERQRLWPVMAHIFPLYDQYLVKAAKHGREVPLIIIEWDAKD